MKDLAIHQEQLLKAVQKNTPGQLLQPLTKEIYLLDTYVADILFARDLPIADLKEGEELLLRHEKTLYSEYTVAVLKKDGLRLGELPSYNQKIFARLLDAGKALKATIRQIDIKQEYQTLVISIYLIDF